MLYEFDKQGILVRDIDTNQTNFDTNKYTTIKPPEEKEGKVRVYDKDKNKWSLVDDFKGVLVYNEETGEEHSNSSVTDIDNGYTQKKPLSAYKRKKLQELINYINGKKTTPFVWTRGEESYSFSKAKEDVQKLKNTYDLAKEIGQEEGQIGCINGLVQVTLDEFKQIITDIGIEKYKIWLEGKKLVSQIEQCKTQKCLKDIVIGEKNEEVPTVSTDSGNK